MQLHQVETTRICLMNGDLEGQIRFNCCIFPHVKFPQGEDLQCHEQDDLLHHVGQHAQSHDLLTLLNAVEQEFGGHCCVERPLEECVGTLNNGYLHKVPLPRVPRDQSTIPVACTATYIVTAQAIGYLLDPWIQLYDNIKRSLLDVSKLVLAPLSPHWLM